MKKRKYETVRVSFQQLGPIVIDCLAQGQEVVLMVTGNSMRPFLRHERDRVVLKKANDPAALQPGQVPLYQRTNGWFVLHRIIERDDGEQRWLLGEKEPLPSAHVGGGVQYTMLGDAQTDKEPGIRPEQIVAVATDFYVRGKRQSCDTPSYRRRTRLWHRLLPYRRGLLLVSRLPGYFPRGIRYIKRHLKQNKKSTET
ncbi:MAG: S24/S26 family peptidase [Clostridia bacterium]|nr:S24/S26 family peptidase [Loktanella sp.]MBQ1950699.1 S24/S26 family peptidase [Clostridia bacterium]